MAAYNRRRIFCISLSAFVIISIIGALVLTFLFYDFDEGVNYIGEKIICGPAKKPLFSGIISKFTRCITYIRYQGLATRCVIEIISDPPDVSKTSQYMKDIVPTNYTSMVTTEFDKCKSQFNGCKGAMEDEDGETCLPLMNCVSAFITKLCT